MRFSYYKTANRIAPYGVVRCGAVMSFCERFWCGLYGLVNIPTYGTLNTDYNRNGNFYYQE